MLNNPNLRQEKISNEHTLRHQSSPKKGL
jgi:hypothetical protein